MTVSQYYITLDPCQPITAEDVIWARKSNCKFLKVRYTKLTPKKVIETVVAHNSKIILPRPGWPFPVRA